jgi:hypothetical protein
MGLAVRIDSSLDCGRAAPENDKAKAFPDQEVAQRRGSEVEWICVVSSRMTA